MKAVQVATHIWQRKAHDAHVGAPQAKACGGDVDKIHIGETAPVQGKITEKEGVPDNIPGLQRRQVWKI
jgi:hypothetical protein